VETDLSPRFSFENYIVGQFNAHACGVAFSVAKGPGGKCNPLFIHSRVGQGKTYLITAVGHEILSRNNRARVLFVCSDEFTSEMINAIRFDRIHDFRNRYRMADVLLVDSVQYFSGKERTEAEFLQIVMSLHNRKKQIIVTADRPPDEISDLEESLKSFFSMGRVIEIGDPDLETSEAILRMKAQERSVDLPEEVVHFMAGLDDNIRIMEGCLLRLLQTSSLKEAPITTALAQEALGDVFPRRFRM
jgi:chromosomal replication initiator protein